MNTVLQLNADYAPMKLTTYERAVELLLEGKAYAVASVPDRYIRSEKLVLPWPSVIALRKYSSGRPDRVKFSTRSVVVRDNFTCFGAGTLVLMATGEQKPIERIVPGDVVIGGDGNPHAVVACGARPAENVVEVKFRGSSDKTIVTSDHLYLAAGGAFTPISKLNYARSLRTVALTHSIQSVDVVDILAGAYPTLDLTVRGGEVRSGRSDSTPLPRWLRLSPDLAYFLGLYCAEGHATQGGVITLTLHQKEEHTLGAAGVRLIPALFGSPAVFRHAPKGNGAVVRTCHKLLARLLRTLVGEYAWDKKTPWSAIGPYAVEYLRGLVQGDGCIDRARKKITLVLTSENLVRGAQGLLWGLGILPTLQQRAPQKKHPTWGLTLQGENYSKFMGLVLGETTEAGERIWGDDLFALRRVQSIRPAEDQQVYDIEVEGVHTFVANGHVVHNCAYCGIRPTYTDGRPDRDRLTADHVIPRAQAKEGRVYLYWSKKWSAVTTWENCVTACKPCNQRKADRTPAQAGMGLRFLPRRPTQADVLRMSLWRLRALPPEWADYVPAQADVSEKGEPAFALHGSFSP